MRDNWLHRLAPYRCQDILYFASCLKPAIQPPLGEHHGRHASFVSLCPGGIVPSRSVAFGRRNRPSCRPTKALVPAMGALNPGKPSRPNQGGGNNDPCAPILIEGKQVLPATRQRHGWQDARRRFGLTGTNLCRDAKYRDRVVLGGELSCPLGFQFKSGCRTHQTGAKPRLGPTSAEFRGARVLIIPRQLRPTHAQEGWHSCWASELTPHVGLEYCPSLAVSFLKH